MLGTFDLELFVYAFVGVLVIVLCFVQKILADMDPDGKVKKAGMIILCFALLAACGSGGGNQGANVGHGHNPQGPPVVPDVVNSIFFNCVGVNNDPVCASVLDAPGIFNSGDVHVSGSPMPQDYLNLSFKSSLANSASVFIYSLFKIKGCADVELVYPAMSVEPGETLTDTEALWGYRCGSIAFNESELTIYNASHFDPADYASPILYPRDQAISNAVIRWQNVGAW